ncbi:DNA-binding NarL/FixJ family response regulator [Saccharothrix tamanrassetensis]|uniref:DNA-binding NarL/FixJ family response regulator n=1 Tax=Saccharothrix tamanrassetensis TaxID=1051531 RepID=A0A841CLC0_9PSEU|nr:response regulator transcription factor [Saccharothrix tamanrassetensis]MBB5957164.1 DNA-binding NarL/FixJ family response regulator [Saccharothrix tamanrassetensis]
MRPQTGDHGDHGGDGEEVSSADLIRLAHRHQCIAQELLARVTKSGLGTPAVESGIEVRCTGWNLTSRERSVAELLVEGLSNRRIARKLDISERTVKNHLHSIFYKLGVADRTQAVIKLIRRA